MVNSRKVRRKGGVNLQRDRKMLHPEHPPDKCIGCPYGQWRDTVMYCPWINCVKEESHVKAAQ